MVIRLLTELVTRLLVNDLYSSDKTTGSLDQIRRVESVTVYVHESRSGMIELELDRLFHTLRRWLWLYIWGLYHNHINEI